MPDQPKQSIPDPGPSSPVLTDEESKLLEQSWEKIWAENETRAREAAEKKERNQR